ncbi:MAG: hypothetical protein ACFFBD_06685 [Candidatus Hodarchaeota archaeon]
MEYDILKLLNQIMSFSKPFTSYEITGKNKSILLRILVDLGLLERRAKYKNSYYYSKSAWGEHISQKESREFILDQLFLKMSKWVNEGFSSRNFPQKKVILMLFRSGHLIKAVKLRGHWNVTLTLKGRILNIGYLALVRNETNPLVQAFKNAIWYALEGLDSQQKALCSFYRSVLDVMSSSPDLADSMDNYGVLGGRTSSLINRIATLWGLEESNVLIKFQELSKIPEFIQLEGDRQTMKQNAFFTIYPLKLETAVLKKGLSAVKENDQA